MFAQSMLAESNALLRVTFYSNYRELCCVEVDGRGGPLSTSGNI